MFADAAHMMHINNKIEPVVRLASPWARKDTLIALVNETDDLETARVF